MIGLKKTAMLVLLVGLVLTETSQAALIARTGGMVYDDVNNITWAADANLFKTQAASNTNLVSDIIAGNGGGIYSTTNYYDGYSYIYSLTSTDFNISTGKMTWFGAQAWANNLTLGGVKGWNLPTTTYMGGLYNQAQSQMGDLFYNQLGGVAGTSITMTHNANYNLFTNVHDAVYWSGSDYVPTPYLAWVFVTNVGSQNNYPYPRVNKFYALAVHAGDVAAIPVPAAVWLFGSGLIGLLSFNRRKNKTANVIAA